ncbi:MAG: response regulator transcription factor [Rhodospirillaceae bacterium]|nr:response regulator transcription factor [Rhodospirillaceae bacterium]MCY4238303.1 response regulator transcription factor [Rhodospirillaceae bacterium]
MKILIIEDDTETADYVAKGLEEAGHTVDVARDGKNGLVMIVGEAFDAAIVDRMLPGIDGKTIVETVRGAGKTTPILLLSAMGEVRHRVEGLHSGADDYLIKPFAFSELLARVEALGRRPKEEFRDETVLRVGDLEVNRLTRDVARSGQKIDLQPREYRLLEYLMRHAGRVVTRTMLLEHVWDYHFDPQTNVIDVHVSRLRQKIDKDFKIPLLHTVRGAGYSLRAADSTS